MEKKYTFEFNFEEVEAIENALLHYICHKRDFYRKFNSDEAFYKDRLCPISLELHDAFYKIVETSL